MFLKTTLIASIPLRFFRFLSLIEHVWSVEHMQNICMRVLTYSTTFVLFLIWTLSPKFSRKLLPLVSMESHLLSNSLYSSFQSAYRMFHSTETTLLMHSQSAMDRGEVTSLNLLDLSALSDLSVMSRMMEKMVVRELLYPSLISPPSPLTFDDQFAFRPAGSTTAALIAMLQTISNLLLTNEYVIVIALDFSKAFVTVKHSKIAEKLSPLDLPPNVYNWVSISWPDTHTVQNSTMSSQLSERLWRASSKAPVWDRLRTS